MTKQFGDYRRLDRSGMLWEGPDHLLCIEYSGWPLSWRESYRRIDYAKIETVSYGRSSGFVWIVALFVFFMIAVGVVLALLIVNRAPVAASIVVGVLELLLLVLLGVHIARGPTCVCKLQTSVQVLRLRSLKRVRTTETVAARLLELCQLHQTAVGSELPAAVDPTAPLVQPVSSATTNAIAGAAIKQPYPGLASVLWALWLSLATAVTLGAKIAVGGYISSFLAIVMVGGAGTCAAAAAARGAKYELGSALKWSIWGEIGAFVLSILTAVVLYVQALIVQVEHLKTLSNPNQIMGNEFEWLRWLFVSSYKELGWSTWLVGLTALCYLVFALVGLPPALRPPVAPKSETPFPPAPPPPATTESPPVDPAPNP